MPPHSEAAAARLLVAMKHCGDLVEDIEAAVVGSDAAYAASLVRNLQRWVTDAGVVVEAWTVEQQKEM